jgi:type IV secretory pathway TraG/TraD family ATPase VirD4
MSALKANKIQIVKYSPPPPELPVLGDSDQKETSFIGRTNYVAALEEKKYVFGIKRNDRKRHLYILGKAGTGKSKLEELLIRQDIAYGYGVCVIDPHGELTEDLLNFIPENRINDVCLINPEDKDFPISFNPLANVEPGFKHQFVQSWLEVIKKEFESNWSSKIEHIFRFITMALLDYPKSSMQGMILILIDEAYRNDVIKYIEDPMVKNFWENEFTEWSQKSHTDTVLPIVNKFGQFLYDPLLKNIFSNSENKVDFAELMDNKKIILINLAKGEIGEENSSILGMIFIAKIKQACTYRIKTKKDKSVAESYLYIDEFHNMITNTFENILSEGKKYGINLTMAHQYINQLPAKTQQALMGNVGSIITFRIGGEDALKLKPEYAPIFDVKDMINLGVGEFYIKMTIDGESYDPFSAEILKVLEPTHESYKERIVKASREKYSIN